MSTHSPSTGANYYDYWLLYSHIKSNKPREVLEFGPGLTTLVIAQALYENGSGRVTAMEDLQKYYDALQAIIPRSSVPSYRPAAARPSHQVHYGPFRGKAYQSIPSGTMNSFGSMDRTMTGKLSSTPTSCNWLPRVINPSRHSSTAVLAPALSIA